MPKASQVALTSVTKPVTTLSNNNITQSVSGIPVGQSQVLNNCRNQSECKKLFVVNQKNFFLLQSGNVILLDLSNQESISKNAAIAELLQASGLLGDSLTVLDKSKNVNSGEEVEIVNASESQILEIEEKDLKQQEVTTRENSGSFSVSTLSIGEVNFGNLCRKENKIFPIIFTYKNFIEEAVEMLNRSDTPETRALLSQAGIQISDEIGDSEEEEVLGVKMDDTDFEEEVIN